MSSLTSKQNSLDKRYISQSKVQESKGPGSHGMEHNELTRDKETQGLFIGEEDGHR